MMRPSTSVVEIYVERWILLISGVVFIDILIFFFLFCLFGFVLFFETGFLCVALAVLEITL